MSRQVRNRVTATALGGFLLGAAVLMTGTASADQVGGSGRQVVFGGGGVLGFSCTSTPSAEFLTVPSEGTVRVVNRTGHRAKLRLDGHSMGSLPDDGSTEVVFRRGTTAVTLDPTCTTTDQATPVLVTASPPVPVRPNPTPAPVTSAPDLGQSPAAQTEPGTSDPTIDNDSALPAPVTRPQRSSTIDRRPMQARPKAAHPATSQPARAAATTARRPHGVAKPRIKTRTPVRGTAGAPTSAGTPPRDDRTSRTGVPTRGLQPAPSGAAPAHSAGPSSEMAAAEPVAAMRPLPDTGSLGLLALIASVSVFGVSIGVIRALVSQRAYRSKVA